MCENNVRRDSTSAMAQAHPEQHTAKASRPGDDRGDERHTQPAMGRTCRTDAPVTSSSCSAHWLGWTPTSRRSTTADLWPCPQEKPSSTRPPTSSMPRRLGPFQLQHRRHRTLCLVPSPGRLAVQDGLVVSTKHGWMQLNTDNFGLSSRTRNFYYDRNKTTTTISPRRHEGVPHAHRSTIRSATHENHGGRARPPEVGRISQDQMACVNSS